MDTPRTVDGPAAGPDPIVAELLARVQAMETELAALRTALTPSSPAPPPAVDEDIVIAISAAVAAYFGARARVRQIHLTGDTAWAREGRAYVQSVHSASRRH